MHLTQVYQAEWTENHPGQLHLNTWVFPAFNLNIDRKLTEMMVYSGVSYFFWECIYFFTIPSQITINSCVHLQLCLYFQLWWAHVTCHVSVSGTCSSALPRHEASARASRNTGFVIRIWIVKREMTSWIVVSWVTSCWLIISIHSSVSIHVYDWQD